MNKVKVGGYDFGRYTIITGPFEEARDKFMSRAYRMAGRDLPDYKRIKLKTGSGIAYNTRYAGLEADSEAILFMNYPEFKLTPPELVMALSILNANYRLFPNVRFVINTVSPDTVSFFYHCCTDRAFYTVGRKAPGKDSMAIGKLFKGTDPPEGKTPEYERHMHINGIFNYFNMSIDLNKQWTIE